MAGVTAPINHSAFSLVADPLVITATLWRGAMLERFSRMERCALDCLLELRECGVALPREAFHEGAKTRLETLITVIHDERFGGMRKPTLRYLSQWAHCNEMRSELAHGTIREVEDGFLIEWQRCRGPERIERNTRRFGLGEMLDELVKLDALQRNVSSQLGQIRRIAREAA